MCGGTRCAAGVASASAIESSGESGASTSLVARSELMSKLPSTSRCVATTSHDESSEDRGERIEQRGRCRIDQVRMLDHGKRRNGELRLEESPHDLMQLRAAEVRREIVHLPRARSFGAEGDRNERKPDEQLRIVGLDARAELLDHDCVGVVPADPEQLPQQSLETKYGTSRV